MASACPRPSCPDATEALRRAAPDLQAGAGVARDQDEAALSEDSGEARYPEGEAAGRQPADALDDEVATRILELVDRAVGLRRRDQRGDAVERRDVDDSRPVGDQVLGRDPDQEDV